MRMTTTSEDWTTESDDIVVVPLFKRFFCNGVVRCMALKCAESHFVKWHVQLLYVPFFCCLLAGGVCSILSSLSFICFRMCSATEIITRSITVCLGVSRFMDCHANHRNKELSSTHKKKKHALVAFFFLCSEPNDHVISKRKMICSDESFNH